MTTPNTDAVTTRDRILDAAAELFAEKGYRGTTIRNVCGRAGANVAAVKYHFGSKNELYIETFRRLFRDAGLEIFPDPLPPVNSAADWERALDDWAHRLLTQIIGPAPHQRWRTRLWSWERTVPTTEALPTIIREFLMPVQNRLEQLLRMAVPPATTDADLLIWTVSTISQCTMYAQRESPWDNHLIPRNMTRATWIDRVSRQVVGSVTSRLAFRRPATPEEGKPPK